MQRRTVLKGAAIAPWVAARASAANSAVTVGLIGAGSRGTYTTGLVVKHTPARVVAVCDIVDGKGEKAAKAMGLENPKLYKDFHQLLNTDVEGCKRIMRAADAADRKLHITFGFQRRYGLVYQKAKQLADSGAIGPIR